MPSFIQICIDFLAELVRRISARPVQPKPIDPPAPAPVPVPPPAPVPEPAPAPVVPVVEAPLTIGQIMAQHDYTWAGGPIELRRSMYAAGVQICKEEGLSSKMTVDLLATVWGESGWNPYCVNTHTFDYGLCQFSKIYYLVEYKMTPQDALLQPLRCFRIMARNFKAGRADNWVAFSSGAYRKFLNRTV